MAINMPLEDISVEEKLQVMAIIWDDLCHNGEESESPPWHETVLTEREDDLKRGADAFMDWDAAKKSIRRNIE